MANLSPAAQAIKYSCDDLYNYGCPSDNDLIVAALRALADQAGSAKHWHVNELRAIATELEGSIEPTFTPEEIEMIQAPWSYLQSQEELEGGR